VQDGRELGGIEGAAAAEADHDIGVSGANGGQCRVDVAGCGFAGEFGQDSGGDVGVGGEGLKPGRPLGGAHDAVGDDGGALGAQLAQGGRQLVEGAAADVDDGGPAEVPALGLGHARRPMPAG